MKLFNDSLNLFQPRKLTKDVFGLVANFATRLALIEDNFFLVL